MSTGNSAYRQPTCYCYPGGPHTCISGEDIQRPGLTDRFYKFVNKTESCWVWTGSLTNGYGTFTIAGQRHQAHRASWIINCGEIPDGMWVLHKCDNPPCVNPDHLFIGDHTDNVIDRESKGRGTTAAANAARRKLTQCQVAEILFRHYEQKITVRQLAEQFSVSYGCVNSIVYRQNWKWLNPAQCEESCGTSLRAGEGTRVAKANGVRECCAGEETGGTGAALGGRALLAASRPNAERGPVTILGDHNPSSVAKVSLQTPDSLAIVSEQSGDGHRSAGLSKIEQAAQELDDALFLLWPGKSEAAQRVIKARKLLREITNESK